MNNVVQELTETSIFIATTMKKEHIWLFILPRVFVGNFFTEMVLFSFKIKMNKQ